MEWKKNQGMEESKKTNVKCLIWIGWLVCETDETMETEELELCTAVSWQQRAPTIPIPTQVHNKQHNNGENERKKNVVERKPV